MSTRATIKFSDPYNTFYVYRGCDGFPENVMPDIQSAIEKAKFRWSNPECELLVTLFLAIGYDFDKKRLPDYTITSSFHGDESYLYAVQWDGEKRDWAASVIEGGGE